MKNWVSYILLLLIALQSVLMVDAHQDSHPDAVTQQGLEQHQSAVAIDIDDSTSSLSVVGSDQQTEDWKDCQHSHCSHLHFIPTTAPGVALSRDENQFNTFICATPNALAFPLYRPPIV